MDALTKLKAEAYDIIANIQQLQNLLAQKNQEIAEKLNAQPKEAEKK